MEQLIQRYIKYFYLTLIGIIFTQLLDVIFATLKGNLPCDTFIVMFLSVINIILLIGNMVYNSKQKFTECKANAKILRLTTAILMGFQALLCYRANPSIVELGNHLMSIIIIEIVFNYRIKSIEHLEKLANKLTKDTTPK